MALSWLDIFIIGCVVISMNWITEVDICKKIDNALNDVLAIIDNHISGKDEKNEGTPKTHNQKMSTPQV